MALVGFPAGLSNYDAGTAASGTVAAVAPTIYGGYAGALGTCATPDSSSTCNSCDGTAGTSGSPKWCNPTSIHPALVLKVTLSSSTPATFQGTPKVYYRLSGGSVAAGSYTPDNATAISLAAGQAFTVEIKWSNLCRYVNGDASCLTSFSGVTLNVGIDNNDESSVLEEKVSFNLVMRSVAADVAASPAVTHCPANTTPTVTTEGICDYTMSPGDGKVYITDYAASGNDLLTSDADVKFDRLAIFYETNVTDATTVTNISPKVTLNLKNNAPNEPSISEQRITGLQNEIPYCFAMANVDQTGNITYFPTLATLGLPQVCATPSLVVGLLDDKHCFIATATFGSEMAPEVQTFREFRNRFLLTNSFGRFLVSAYYKFGPKAAEWISQSEGLRTLSVWVLWPLLLFVKLSLWLGLAAATLVALITLVLVVRVTGQFRSKRRTLRGEL